MYRRNVPEYRSHCILTDLPLFRLFHVSNQVRGRKRVKPGAVLVAYMATPDGYPRHLALGLRACISSWILSAKVNEYVHRSRNSIILYTEDWLKYMDFVTWSYLHEVGGYVIHTFDSYPRREKAGESVGQGSTMCWYALLVSCSDLTCPRKKRGSGDIGTFCSAFVGCDRDDLWDNCIVTYIIEIEEQWVNPALRI